MGETAKATAYGGAVVALTAAIAWLGWFVPFLSLLFLVAPAPFLFYAERFGIKRAALALVALLIVLAPTIPMPYGLLLGLQFGVVGSSLGEAVRRGKSASEIIIWGTTGALIVLAVNLAFIAKAGGFDKYVKTLVKQQKEVWESAFSFVERFQGKDPRLAEFKQNVFAAVEEIPKVLPALFFMASVIQTVLTYWLSREILVRMGENLPPLPGFSRLYLGPYTVIAYAATVAASYLVAKFRFLEPIVANVSLVLTAGLWLEGLSLAYFFLKRYLGRLLSAILLFVAGFNPVVYPAFVVAGLIDCAMDIRGITKPEG